MANKNISLTRRSMLHCMAFAGAAAVSTSISGRAVAGAEGAPVWLDMSQKELDDAYSQSILAPNIGQVIDRFASNSELVRNRIGEPLRFAYGAGAVEGLDVFTTKQPNSPVHIFVHGGAWQQGSAQSYAFPAELFINAGVHYVVPDFSWIQDVGDSLFPIGEQLRKAVAWVYRNAGKFGADPERIYISGHSSGAHLAGVLLTTDWESHGMPADVIKGGLCCSGMFDMKPVRLSARGDYVKFTDEMEDAFSPIRHLEQLRAPLIIAYGSFETREFKRQSREFAKAATDAGKDVELVVAENYNHVEIIETLANPYGILGHAVLRQLRSDI